MVKCSECGQSISSKATACPSCGAPRKAGTSVGTGCLAVFLGLGLVVAIIGIARGPNDQSPASRASTAPATTSPSPADKAVTDARFEECRTKLKKSQELDLLHNMTFDNGLPKLWVGRTWYQLPIEAKTEFARVGACFFLAGNDGPGGRAITFPIYDGMSGKQIATWKFTRLDVE